MTPCVTARRWLVTAVGVCCWVVGGVQAQTLSDQEAVAQATLPATRLAETYSGLFGSTAAARTAIDGLRTGGTVGLTGADGSQSSFTSPVGPMGYGTINLTLGLARQLLSSQSITAPTADQMQTALTGGVLNGATVDGVLGMREDGMGWGQIAQAMGVTLGSVVSASKTAHTRAPQTARPAVSPSATERSDRPEASGRDAGATSGRGNGNGGGHGGGNGGGGGGGKGGR